MTFMVKIKELKKFKFATEILKLTWDLSVGLTPTHYTTTIIELLTELKKHLFTQEENVDIDNIEISSNFKGISLLLLSPQLRILPIAQKDIYGYIFGMRVVMNEDNTNIMTFKYKNKLIGEIKILNYG